ncbi:hypothetical protein HNQ93_002657 [Hymenobacter luteus]|uniref:XRE family transcriptional regulator n=2 Tax=Hymenobacter TaxID=89966 RepID=A0A7W9WDL5_9BACT|nr:MULTISPECIES: helix-turn-helix transcriptional regulator [Hymenobacter]MBB4601774.1 hypothetical protein [Hymenobacter latericoloratus]MBB6059797.1 hypothetical protein [Hymenobacter luteus]
MADSSTVGQRIAQFIQQLGISKNAFAISLDKTATVIQHLVEERNKPGFDLLCKIFEVYPNISKDWLLQGVGPMLHDATENRASEREPKSVAATIAAPVNASAAVASSSSVVDAAPLNVATAPEQASSPVAPSVSPVTLPAPEAAAVPLSSPQPVVEVPAPAPAVASAPTAAPDTSWQTALYTQQMAHQLALAELRNQHLQEQQRLMQQMMDLMQRQLTR